MSNIKRIVLSKAPDRQWVAQRAFKWMVDATKLIVLEHCKENDPLWAYINIAVNIRDNMDLMFYLPDQL